MNRAVVLLAFLALVLAAGCAKHRRLSERWILRVEDSPIPEAGGHHEYLQRRKSMWKKETVASHIALVQFIGDDCVYFLERQAHCVVCGDGQPVVIASDAGSEAWIFGTGGLSHRGKASLRNGRFVENMQIVTTPEMKEAARTGKIPEPREVLKPLDLGRRAGHTGRTPLMQAVIDGDAELVRAMLAAGADIDATDRYGSSALHFAANQGDAAVVAALLEQKPKLDEPDTSGITPLMRAVSGHNEEAARLLTEAGALTSHPR